jgi:hypothetical protein
MINIISFCLFKLFCYQLILHIVLNDMAVCKGSTSGLM